MNDLRSMMHFILTEGALLAVLFFFVALLVALLQQSVGQKLSDALGKTSLGTGAVFAATAGAVTPFCSCSTVPILSGMLQSRVRFGICFTFLIASPLINEGVLIVLMRQQSMGQAALFLVLAFILSVAFGVLVDRLGMARFLRVKVSANLEGATQVGGADQSSVPFLARLRFAASGAWTELRSATPYLAVGIVAGALIYGYVPDDAVVYVQQMFPGPMLIIVMALLGAPFYVNAAMVVPIALALSAKGLGIGPVAAFLVSAAGTSIPEMIMLVKLFRAPLMLWHFIAIVVSASVIGFALEYASKFF